MRDVLTAGGTFPGDTRPAYAAYDAIRARLLDQLADIPAGAPVRLAKRTSNLFRQRAATTTAGLDVTGLDGVLAVDPAARTADVLGMTTYEHLVDATLAHGLMPRVVPQLKTITLGGAVTGLGIESSSFRNGLPHESVLEMDILTGDGRIVTARPDNAHRELFFGFPNSYGTLGYALRLTIELEPVAPFVRLRHLRYTSASTAFAELAEICAAAAYGGASVDFVDGTVFAPDDIRITLGSWAGQAPYTSDYTGMDVYYRSVQRRREDYLAVRDYLWRWDTDWFWCSAALGVQRPAVRRLVPKRYLRSDVFWKLVAFERRYGPMRRLDRLRGRSEREPVVQDVEVPVDRVAEFLDFFDREIGIAPVWVCPLRQRDPARSWPLYALDPTTLYVNVGFWSSVPIEPGQPEGAANRAIEAKVAELGGRKSLYSTAYYPVEQFWVTYNGAAYHRLKTAYDGSGRLLDLYAKCVQRR
jgi:FAD/FMN-containing dehydrogenase